MTKPKSRGGVRVGQGSPDHALTFAYLPLGVFIAALLSGLFSFAFQLGFAPPLISLGLLAILIAAVCILTQQFSTTAAAGTRLTLAHMGLVCLLGGVAAAPPAVFPDLMLWSLAVIAAGATAIIALEAWLAEKIDAAGPFSRRLGHEASALLVLSAAVLLWRSGRVDAWIIGAGAIHYGVLALSLKLPLCHRQSPAIWRPYLRPAVIATLVAALLPVLPPVVATVLGVVALGLAGVGAAADINAART